MYEFTEDWFSLDTGEQVESTFWKHLLPYRGTPCNFLEIGSFEGRSTIWMLEKILTHPESKLTCIDAWAEWTGDAFTRFTKNLHISGKKDKGDVIKGSSQHYAGLLPREHFDFIYVDGDHEASSVFQDAAVCFSLLKPGGIMALDDYLLGLKYPDSPGSLAVTQHPKETIDFFLKIFKDRIDVIHKDYQLWIRKGRKR